VKAFLSQLAVKGRVSAATQRQALNGLVFLFREALGRDPGDLSGYEVSRRGARVPMVLSRLFMVQAPPQEGSLRRGIAMELG
jgi:hypothetical protein